MTWRTLWLGSERLSVGRVVATSVLLGFVGLTLLGLFVDFIPVRGLYSSEAAAVFFMIGLALSVALLMHAAANKRLRAVEQTSVLKTALVIAFLPVMIGFMVWAVLVKALPWTFTRVFGQPYAFEATVRTEHRNSRRSCDYRIDGGPLDTTFPGFVCISERYYAAHPDRQVVMLMSGRRTVLGFALTSIKHVRDVDE